MFEGEFHGESGNKETRQEATKDQPEVMVTCLDYRGRIGEDRPDLEYIMELNPIVLDCGQGWEGLTCKDGTKNDSLDINTEGTYHIVWFCSWTLNRCLPREEEYFIGRKLL